MDPDVAPRHICLPPFSFRLSSTNNNITSTIALLVRMASDLETSQDAAADDSIGSSQDDVVMVPTTPTTSTGGLSLVRGRKTPASEKRKKSTPDPAALEAKRLKLEEKAKREEKKKQEEEEKKKRIQEREEAKRKADEEKQRKNEEKLKQQEEKRKQQEEKKRIADEEKRIKMEEKQKRDDEKRVKEDERLKKQEEKRKQMEAKQKQDEDKIRQQEELKKREERSKQILQRFFKKADATPTKSPSSSSAAAASSARPSDESATLAFLPFQLKPNQILVPVVKEFVKERFEIGVFDSLFLGQYESEDLYLKELKSGAHVPIRDGMRVRKGQESDVVVIDEETKKFKVKLLQFHSNTRPAWCGTWKKKSNHVTARRPFGRDKKWFDYEVDSDDEWEEEEAGESLAGSDNEGELEDDYEIDNEFMVPHGYLSGEEEENAEEETEQNANFRETEMTARKHTKFAPLRPVSIGCVWSHQLSLGQQGAASDFLKKYQIVFNTTVKS